MLTLIYEGQYKLISICKGLHGTDINLYDWHVADIQFLGVNIALILIYKVNMALTYVHKDQNDTEI